MNDYIIEDNGKIAIMQFNKLLEFKESVILAITLKKYNNGFKRIDDINFRETKYYNIARWLNVNTNDFIIPIQKHTNNIKIIEENKNLNLNNVDGLITNIKNIPLVTTFADCIPIFFFDPVRNIIANIHSGWVGTTKKIILNALNIMIKRYNCKLNNVLCFIGPSIRRDHFLVNDDVKIIFKNIFKEYLKHNIIIDTDKYNDKGRQYCIDTVLINKLMLNDIGFNKNNIFDCNICTICNSDMFHSRRAEGMEFETNAGIIMLK